ncbi:MAG: nucleotidyltransferase domain-containing protein [Nanoarchaeota archaeon]|nr:nucleotidyltransferase domain-containing protein [Nanoarchaeota archaeon]
MLKIFNDLKPFFEDSYRRINVREYARIRKISPPTASTLLKNLENNNLLKKEKERIYIFYFANKDNDIFINLSRIYWKIQLKELTKYLEQKLTNPTIILFGSLSKAEIKENSDIDLAIFTKSEKKLDLKEFENKLKRKIQVFTFKEKENVKNKELLNNILNGFILSGSW